MRLLFFIESFCFGGKERRLLQIIKYLIQQPNTTVAVAITSEKVQYEEILRLDIQIFNIKKHHGIIDPRPYLAFSKVCKTFKPDIIHTWGNFVNYFAIPTIIIQKIKLVNGQITANTPIPQWKKFIFYHIPFLFSHRILANSKAGLRLYNATPTKSLCIYNGFDSARLDNMQPIEDVKKELGISTKFLVGMVASAVSAKDYPTYLKAAENVVGNRDDVSFICVGNGVLEQFGALVKDDVKHRILLFEGKNNIESIMNACDIGILSTFREGMPNVVIEFMAVGKPVLATPVGGTPELIKNKVDGYLFSVRDVEKLTKLITILLDDEPLRRQLGQNAADKIKNEFDNGKMCKKFHELYREVINES